MIHPVRLVVIALALAATLTGCGAKEKCLDACAQAEQSQKQACANQTGPTKAMCESQLPQTVDACKKGCENARGTTYRW